VGPRTWAGLPKSWTGSRSWVNDHPTLLVTTAERYYEASEMLRGTGPSTQALPVDLESWLDPRAILAHVQGWPEYAGRDVAVIGGLAAWRYMAPVTDALAVTTLLGTYPAEVAAPVLNDVWPQFGDSVVSREPLGSDATLERMARL
jgi:hypothetical protein